ncbi:MAG: hypothetical protein IJH37_08195 [Clostridia bacterium]|nr:hypothetical protein [Clostridia bacterium]
MNKATVDFVIAFIMLFEAVCAPCVYAKHEAVGSEVHIASVQEQQLQIYEIKDDGTDTALMRDDFDNAVHETYLTLQAEETAAPFFSYSNEYYASKYGENGHGYAYEDFMSKSRSFQSQRVELYNRMLDLCREFATNYADVPTYVIQLADGSLSPDMYRLGNSNIEINFSATGLDMQVEADRLKASHIANEVYFTFKYDHPEYYWLSNRLIVFWSNSNNSINIVPQTFREFRYGKARRAIDERIQRSLDWYLDAVRNCGYYNAQSMEKTNSYYVCALLRKMIINAVDYGYQEDGKTPIDTGTAHSIVSVLDADYSTKAVCEGYTQTFQLILNKLGIDNIFVTGKAGKSNEDHAWNMVRMPNDSFYYFDITWEDVNAYQTFAMGSRRLASYGGGHKINVSTTEGLGFLYDLPSVPTSDYSSGIGIRNIPCPTPQPDDPLDITDPEQGEDDDPDNAEEVILSGLMREKYDSVYCNSHYSDLLGWHIDITGANGAAAQYIIDFTAYYDGNRIDENTYKYLLTATRMSDGTVVPGFYNGKPVTADDIRSKLVIHAAPNVTITVMPLYFGTDQTKLYQVSDLKRSYTVGQPEQMYISISLKDNTIYKPETAQFTQLAEFLGFYISVYENESAENPAGRAEYGDMYKFEYDGTELVYDDYYNCMRSINIHKAFDDGTNLEDIINKGVLMVKQGCRVVIRYLYSKYVGDTDIVEVNESGVPVMYILDTVDPENRQELMKDLVLTMDPIETDAPATDAPTQLPVSTEPPIDISLTFDSASAVLEVSANATLPEDSRMYIAAYNRAGVLAGVWLTQDSVYTLPVSDTYEIIKVFVLDTELAPKCNMRYIRLKE